MSITDTTANPAPLGLLAFGLTTVLLNMHNAGFFGLDAMIMSMGIFYGGAAQIIAGIMEWRKNNTFGTTAFISYGFFWLSLSGILMFPTLGLSAAPGPAAMAAYLGMWGLFTGVMFVATLRLNRALQAVFATLTILFFLLALGDLLGNAALRTFAGYEGMLCGALAVYAGLAQMLNEVYGRTIAPLGLVKPSAPKS
ncbi:MAG: acetate uptake transporter [Thiohalomonadaceae bacterium]